MPTGLCLALLPLAGFLGFLARLYWERHRLLRLTSTATPPEDATAALIRQAQEERKQRVRELEVGYLASGYTPSKARFEAQYRVDRQLEQEHHERQRELERALRTPGAN